MRESRNHVGLISFFLSLFFAFVTHALRCIEKIKSSPPSGFSASLRVIIISKMECGQQQTVPGPARRGTWRKQKHTSSRLVSCLAELVVGEDWYANLYSTAFESHPSFQVIHTTIRLFHKNDYRLDESRKIQLMAEKQEIL